MNKALGIGALIVVAIITIAFILHGNARYAAGVADERATANATGAAAGNESAKQLERNAHETRKLSDSDIDPGLSKLGIMRNATDY